MLTYGGVPLDIYSDEIAAWIERNISTRDAMEFSWQGWPGKNLSAIAYQGYPGSPTVELNRLTWPLGASRFAVAHFLASDTQISAIRQQAFSPGGYTALPLVVQWQDSGGGEVAKISPLLWLLPPRPLQQIAGANGLWLITLVDDRFFWWSTNTGVLAIDGTSTTWANLYGQIGAAANITITADAVPAAYLKPGQALASGGYEAMPIVLDAVAYNCGQRIARSLSGIVYARSSTNSSIDIAANFSLAAARSKVGGGSFSASDFWGVLPANVRVTFPAVGPGAPASGLYTVNVTLASLALPALPQIAGYDGTKIFHDTARATFAGSGTPTNNAALIALTTLIATDFYRFSAPAFDQKWAGIVPWNPDAQSGSVEWTYRPDEVSTRVRNASCNDLVLELCHGGVVSHFVVPDPGPPAGTTRFLREDATWVGSSLTAVTPLAMYSSGSIIKIGRPGCWGMRYTFNYGTPSMSDTGFWEYTAFTQKRLYVFLQDGDSISNQNILETCLHQDWYLLVTSIGAFAGDFRLYKLSGVWNSGSPYGFYSIDASLECSGSGSDIISNGTEVALQFFPCSAGLTNPMMALGDMITGGASPAGTPTQLSGNTTTTKKFLTQTGTGSASTAPSWGTISTSDVSLGPNSIGDTELTATGVSGNTYGQVTVSTKGRVTAGTVICDVPHGGTGLATLTQYNVMLGAAAGAVGFAAPGTAGYALRSNGASSNPTFQADPAALWDVPHGGTGLATLTQYNVMLGNAAGAVGFAAPGTAGYALRSTGASSNPTFQADPAAALDINGLAAADGSFSDSIPEYKVAVSSNRKLTLDRLGGFLYPSAHQSRLTLTSGTPVTAVDVVNAPYIYCTPYLGNRKSLYDGTRWLMFGLPEYAISPSMTIGNTYDIFSFTSNAAPSSTNTGTDVLTFGSATGWNTGAVVAVDATGGGLTAGTAYFYFAANSTTGSLHATLAGALTGTGKVDLTASIAATLTAVSLEALVWTNSTTRATALVLQDGVNVNATSSTRVYEGTVYATASSGTEDSAANRMVWNAYNQVPRLLYRCPGYVDDNAFSTYASTSTTFAEANGGTNSRVNFVTGLPGAVFDGLSNGFIGAGASSQGIIAVGVDTVSNPQGSAVTRLGTQEYTTVFVSVALSAVGAHYAALLIARLGAANATYYADFSRYAGGAADPQMTYLQGTILA